MTSSRYTFISFARSGMAKAINTVDSFDASIPGRAALTASFSVVGNSTSTPISKDVRLHGPSDVLAIDPRQVIRTEPKALTQNFEPNFFACVELDRPDFPWLMTPARATEPIPGTSDPAAASARLRPWLVLVAVRQQPGVGLTMGQGQALPVLMIDSPALVARELQDLSDSWAWAHAQTVGGMDEADAALGSGPPEHNCSRLICPRRLEPSSAYFACVVPAFKLGVLTGLGIPVTDADESRLDPAWLTSDASVRLPVYFHFEFNTGPNGDFEALADLLEPRALEADDVSLPFDIGSTGDPRLPSGIPLLRLDGALTAGDPPSFDDVAYREALADIVSQPEPSLDPNEPDPIVAPPLYGRWHAARQAVSPGATWLADLNLDPRRRVAAALGTRVVQEHQEALMASAWSQLGEVQKANQALRRAQLAREAMVAAHAGTIARLGADPDRAFALAGPVLRRVLNAGLTVGATLTQSRVPDGVVSSAFRKLTRPRGPIGARLAQAAGNSTLPSIMERTSQNLMSIVPFKTEYGQINGSLKAPGDTLSVFGNPAEELPEMSDAGPLSDSTLDPLAFRSAALTVQRFLGGPEAPRPPLLPSTRPAFDLGLQTFVRSAVHPSLAITTRVLTRLRQNGVPLLRSALDPLEPILAAPEFPQPMYAPLRDLSPDYLLPGAFRVPPNTVTLLETNRQFVEAYMAGLNHEMARELLWRGYPTDQRGTYFAQFWDPSCRLPPVLSQAERVARRDIVPMHTWALASRLGAHQPNDPGRLPGNQIVLIIRGELLRRYPNTIIYAAPPLLDAGGNFVDLDADNDAQPIFRGTLPPDITFLGFNLTDTEVRARGLYFVLEEQPTEPRFGLNEAPPEPIDPNRDLSSWAELSWGHFGADAQFLKLGTLPAARTLPTNPVWGVNSAHLAQITLQTPVRVALFGPDLLPST